jgi:hypothetical protein
LRHKGLPFPIGGGCIRTVEDRLVFNADPELNSRDKEINKLIVFMMQGSLFRLCRDRLCHAIAFNIKISYLAEIRMTVPVPAT